MHDLLVALQMFDLAVRLCFLWILPLLLFTYAADCRRLAHLLQVLQLVVVAVVRGWLFDLVVAHTHREYLYCRLRMKRLSVYSHLTRCSILLSCDRSVEPVSLLKIIFTLSYDMLRLFAPVLEVTMHWYTIACSSCVSIVFSLAHFFDQRIDLTHLIV